MQANLIAFIFGFSLFAAAEVYSQESAPATPLWFASSASTDAASTPVKTNSLWFQPNQATSKANSMDSQASSSLWLAIPKAKKETETSPSTPKLEKPVENQPLWIHALNNQATGRQEVAGRSVVAAAILEEAPQVAPSRSFWTALPSTSEQSVMPADSMPAKSPSTAGSPASISSSRFAIEGSEPSDLVAIDEASPYANEVTWAAESQSAASGEANFDDLVSGLTFGEEPSVIADQHRSEIIVEEQANDGNDWWSNVGPVQNAIAADTPENTASPSMEQLIRSAQFASQRDDQTSPSDAPATQAPPINIVMDEDETDGSSAGSISDSESKSPLLDAESMISRGSNATSLFGRLEVEDQFRNDSQYIATAARVNEMQVEWMPSCYTWISPVFYHKPLYFEQPNLERYGLGCVRPLQPLISSAHFFGSIPLVPYKTLTHHPREKVYTLGHGRPGNCVPVRRNVLLGESTVGEGLLFWDKCSGYAE